MKIYPPTFTNLCNILFGQRNIPNNYTTEEKLHDDVLNTALSAIIVLGWHWLLDALDTIGFTPDKFI